MTKIKFVKGTNHLENVKMHRDEENNDNTFYWDTITGKKIDEDLIPKFSYCDEALRTVTDDMIAKALSEETGLDVTGQNFDDWMEGGESYDLFDEVVLEFVGQRAYDELSVLARLPDYVCWRLGLGSKNAGGVVFKK